MAVRVYTKRSCWQLFVQKFIKLLFKHALNFQELKQSAGVRIWVLICKLFLERPVVVISRVTYSIPVNIEIDNTYKISDV